MAAGACVALAACGSSGGATPKPASSPGPHTEQLTLQGAPLGSVKLSWSPATRRVTASVSMYDLTPGSSHAFHVHAGTCASPGSILVGFPDLTASATGAVHSTVTGAATLPHGLPAGTGSVNVHLASSSELGRPGSLGFTPISCADIPMGMTRTASLKMLPPPQPGLHPAGTAALTYSASARTLTVEVSASGLPPSSSHAEHIHIGTCAAQGAVKYDLSPLVASKRGTAAARTVIRRVTSAPPARGWYLNVHMGSSSAIVSGGRPTLAFQPVLCGNIRG